MANKNRVYDDIHFYMSQIGANLVAQSGRPSDRFHLGKITLHCLEKYPDFILQIDGATGGQESCGSVRERSVRCAARLRAAGVRQGDVLALLAPNHLDLCIPFYAALYLGVIIMAVDRTLKDKELQDTFAFGKPKIVFCQNEKGMEVHNALKAIDCESEIITFDSSDKFSSFSDFLCTVDNNDCNNFKPTDFDENAVAILIPTSGTMGLPKAAEATYKNITIGLMYSFSPMPYEQSANPSKSSTRTLISSPLQWLSALAHFFFSPILTYTRIQTSDELSQENFYHLINKYKPNRFFASPNLVALLVKEQDCKKCDFTCFTSGMIGGSAVTEQLIDTFQKLAPDCVIFRAYAMSELCSICFYPNNSKENSCGTQMGIFQYRLQNPDTDEEILEPYVNGELQLKGITIFKGYYNNKKATEEAFTKDGWFRTGDIFYRDETYHYYFAERLKLLMKYRNHQISPLELENVIRTHPGVFDVAVIGIAHPEHGDLPLACVVRQQGSDVTAQEIKDLVKNNLTDTKQLTGGVTFLEKLPMTATMKIHRKKLSQLVPDLNRE